MLQLSHELTTPIGKFVNKGQNLYETGKNVMRIFQSVGVFTFSKGKGNSYLSASPCMLT